MISLLLVFVPHCLAGCSLSILSASSSATKVVRSATLLTPSTELTAISVWVAIPGAKWIWESNSQSTGFFNFLDTFAIPEWVKAACVHINLVIAVDNTYAVKFNGSVIAPRGSGDYSHTTTYDLKPFALGSSATLGVRTNKLEIEVENTWLSGGVAYAVEVVY